MKEKRIKIFYHEDYEFRLRNRQLRVFGGDKEKGEEELKRIYQAYEEVRYHGRPLLGEFRFCQNPECDIVLYAQLREIKGGHGSYCSISCSASMVGFTKGQRVARPKKRNILEQFKNLTSAQQKELFGDTIIFRNPEEIGRLNELLDFEEGRTIILGICFEVPANFAIGPALNEFRQVEEGEKLDKAIQETVNALARS